VLGQQQRQQQPTAALGLLEASNWQHADRFAEYGMCVAGFVRVAVEEGLDGGIVPVYHSGNTEVGHQYAVGARGWCQYTADINILLVFRGGGVKTVMGAGLDGSIVPVYQGWQHTGEQSIVLCM
jgi:hypothetical protein